MTENQDFMEQIDLVDIIRANNHKTLEQMARNQSVNFADEIMVDLSGVGKLKKPISPLIWAAMWGSVDCLKVILENIPAEKIEGKSDKGKTALMYAAEFGYPCIIKELLEFQADFSKVDVDGKTAYDLAFENGYEGCMEVLGEAVVQSEVAD